MSGSKGNRWLGRIGEAALSYLTEEEIRADPVRAVEIAQSVMRAALHARNKPADPASGNPASGV